MSDCVFEPCASRLRTLLGVSDNEFVAEPDQPCGTGVLVLSGSSGGSEVRARSAAAHGATAVALRWFGGIGQKPGPWEVPLETFTDGLSRLTPRVDRLALVGTSFGAEAALLTAVLDGWVTAVVAVAPSPVFSSLRPAPLLSVSVRRADGLRSRMIVVDRRGRG